MLLPSAPCELLRNATAKFGTRLMEDDTGESQNISSREVGVILLWITVIFRLVASSRFDSALRLSPFPFGGDGKPSWRELWIARIAALPFLIIRASKHHREIIAAERNERAEMTLPQLRWRIDTRRWYEKHEPARKAVSWLGDTVSPVLYSALCTNNSGRV